MTVQDSARSYLGIAKEVTKGTAVAPTDFFPINISKCKGDDKIAQLKDQGFRGSSVKNYGSQQGRQYATYDLGGAVFADMLGYFLGGLLGECVTVGVSAPYTHTFSLKNSVTAGADTQPTAFTITDFYAAAVRAWSGMQIDELTLNFTKDGLLEFDAKATGWQSAGAATPTPTFSGVIPTPVWQGTVTIGGSAVSNMVDGSITMKRNPKPEFGISNVKTPFTIFVGPLEVTFKFTFLMEADTELTRYLTNTQPAIVLNWANGAGATATQIQATVTKGNYETAMIDRSKDTVEVHVTGESLGNLTDAGTTGYSPIKWVLQNAKVAGTYQ